MNESKNLFLKIMFVIVSSSLISLWLFFIIENKILGFTLGLFFAIIFGSSLRKIYMKLFEEDIFTQYLYLFVIIPIIVFAFIIDRNAKIDEKERIDYQKVLIKNKINSMLDTCNYYEAKLYENNLLFKIKKDSNEYLVSEGIEPYSKFEILKHNSKYDYLISSFIKCPRDSSELVYIFDNQGSISVILKLKNANNSKLDTLKYYLKQLQDI